MICFQIYLWLLILFNQIIYSSDSIFYLNNIFLIYNLFNIFIKYFFEIFIILYNESFSFAIVIKVHNYFLSYLLIKISQYMWIIKLFSNLIFFSLFIDICILHLFFVSNTLIISHVNSFSSFIFIILLSIIFNHFFNSFLNDICIWISVFIHFLASFLSWFFIKWFIINSQMRMQCSYLMHLYLIFIMILSIITFNVIIFFFQILIELSIIKSCLMIIKFNISFK